jgi:hypothetical protein
MKTPAMRRILAVLLLSVLAIAPLSAWARLPRPIQANGIVLAMDADTRTLVFKQSKGKKPRALDWDKSTEFNKDGQPASATELKEGASVVIHYRTVSFHNPLLTKVVWTGDARNR